MLGDFLVAFACSLLAGWALLELLAILAGRLVVGDLRRNGPHGPGLLFAETFPRIYDRLWMHAGEPLAPAVFVLVLAVTVGGAWLRLVGADL